MSLRHAATHGGGKPAGGRDRLKGVSKPDLAQNAPGTVPSRKDPRAAGDASSGAEPQDAIALSPELAQSLAPQKMPVELLSAVDQALDRPLKEVPQMQLARSLEEAGPKTFVYIDSQGKVRPPTQYRMMQAASYAMLTTILVGGSVLYTYLWGVMGLLFPLVFGSLVGRNLLVTRRINQAALLSSHDRLDEAEAILRRLLKRRGLGRRLRALCHHNLGAVATRRGDHAEALVQLRQAISLYQESWRKSPHLRSCQYGEVIALCNLGQMEEARERLLSVHKAEQGDYLQLKYWTTELYLRFCAGEEPPPPSELWERAERALKITASSALLALCAWAYTKGRTPDQDMAWHLLREAIDRLDNEPLGRIMPPLWKWMAQNRSAAESAA